MEVYELIQEPRPCSYIAGLEARFHYLYIKECSIAFYMHLLERGWRRFGNYFFVPVCEHCEACISIRQDCEKFVFCYHSSLDDNTSYTHNLLSIYIRRH